jgi:hypothetical protein
MSNFRGFTKRAVGAIPADTPYTLIDNADGTKRVVYDAVSVETARAPVIRVNPDAVDIREAERIAYDILLGQRDFRGGSLFIETPRAEVPA